MRTCISEVIKKIGLTLQEDDIPSDVEIKRKRETINNPVTSVKVNPSAKLPIQGQGIPEKESEGSAETEAKPQAEISDKVRESKRPHVKPPRREESFKTKWKGEGKREVRNEYQKNYRAENGNT